MRCTVFVLALGVPALSAADPQVVVVEESRGTFVVPIANTEYQTILKQVAAQVNGRTEIQTVSEKVPVTTMKYTVIDAKAGDFLDRAGRPLDPKGVAGLLKKGAVLAVSPDGTPVGPELLKKNEKIVAILLLKPSKAEKGPAPNFGTLEKSRDGGLYVDVTITREGPRQETVTKAVGGRPVTEVVTVKVKETFKMRHSLADATVTDLGGNPVDVKTLRPGARVAVSADFKPIDPAHLKELKGVAAVVVPKEVLP